MAFAVIEDAEDKDLRLMLHAKNNLAAPPQGLAYRLKQTIVGEAGKGITASYVDWEANPVSITANEALAAEVSNNGPKPCQEAETFLRELLANGALPQKQVKADADESGLSWATVRRAKSRLNIKPYKSGMDGGWMWMLPKVLNEDEDAHVIKVSTFEGGEHLRANGVADVADAIGPNGADTGVAFRKVAPSSTEPDPWADIDIPPEFDRRRKAVGDGIDRGAA